MEALIAFIGAPAILVASAALICWLMERDHKALDRELDRMRNRPTEKTQATDRQLRRWQRAWETFGNG